jgi:hypothetical protein
MEDKKRSRLRRGLFASALVLGVSGFAPGCSSEPPVCETTRDYFATKVWPIVSTKCAGCHSPDGQARETSYVLAGTAVAGFLDRNLAVIRDVAAFEKDGESLYLLKPAAKVAHEGGAIAPEGSPDYEVLAGLVRRFKQEEECVEQPSEPFAGVQMLSAEATLRKAAIILAGRLPSSSELDRVANGGLAEVGVILDEMMAEPVFLEHIKSVYNDFFTTDFYLRNDASSQINGAYADPDWYDDETADVDAVMLKYGIKDRNELQSYTNWGVAREPLELIAHVVANDRPFTEVLTADYIMVTPLSARSYGVSPDFPKDAGPLTFVEAKIPEIPHAGFLTSPMFLNRHTTTATNRNRHRAKVVYQAFLGTDILKTAEQAVDQAKVTDFNPTRNNPACTVCHATIDPIAGAFMSWNADGSFSEEPEWFQEMFEPGLGQEKLPESKFSTGLQWLSSRMVDDPGFALGAVYMMYEGIIGRARLVGPSDFTDPTYNDQLASYLAQANTFGGIANKFSAAEFNLKVIVKELVMSPYFRAANSGQLTPQRAVQLAAVGLGHQLTPEQLSKKIKATLGVQWLDSQGEPMLDYRSTNPGEPGRHQLFYGGIDSDNVTKRTREPNGLLTAVADRMANDMACLAVPRDFQRPIDERVLFPEAEVDGQKYDLLSLAPETDAGVTVEPVVVAIKQNIAHLHKRLLGETLEANSPEVEATYKLFLDIWRDGKKEMTKDMEPLSKDLPSRCRVTTLKGQDLPEDDQIVADEDYVVRAWMAVTTYLLSDYRFLYE